MHAAVLLKTLADWWTLLKTVAGKTVLDSQMYVANHIPGENEAHGKFEQNHNLGGHAGYAAHY